MATYQIAPPEKFNWPKIDLSIWKVPFIIRFSSKHNHLHYGWSADDILTSLWLTDGVYGMVRVYQEEKHIFVVNQRKQDAGETVSSVLYGLAEHYGYGGWWNDLR